MKAEVAFPALQNAARTLKAYTTSPRWHTATRLLHLRTHSDTLTLTAGTGDDVAEVDLPGGHADGDVAITPDDLLKALTAMRPKGKAAATATVGLVAEPNRLHLTVNGGSAVGLDTEPSPPTNLACLPAMPAARPVTTGPVGDWCNLVQGVGRAAGHDPSRPELAVVRLHRDHPGTVLMVEAVDRYRAHRGRWGEPTGGAVDARIPIPGADRAVRLLTATDPHGHLLVDVDDERIRWQTDTVRVALRTRGEPFPDLERIREEIASDATLGFRVDRQHLLAALDTATALAATTRHGRIHLETTPAGTDVSVYTDSGAPLHRIPLPVSRRSLPHTLTLQPTLLRQAVAFLDGPHIDLAATVGRLAMYLHGEHRHAIVMQTAA